MIEGMNWTELIRALRATGLTQEEIAASVGVSQPSISDLANGKTKNPSFEVGSKLRKLHARKTRTVKAEV